MMQKPIRSDAYEHAIPVVVLDAVTPFEHILRRIVVRQFDASAAKAAYLKSP
jgi:hypothetical protein